MRRIVRLYSGISPHRGRPASKRRPCCPTWDREGAARISARCLGAQVGADRGRCLGGGLGSLQLLFRGRDCDNSVRPFQLGRYQRAYSWTRTPISWRVQTSPAKVGGRGAHRRRFGRVLQTKRGIPIPDTTRSIESGKQRFTITLEAAQMRRARARVPCLLPAKAGRLAAVFGGASRPTIRLRPIVALGRTPITIACESNRSRRAAVVVAAARSCRAIPTSGHPTAIAATCSSSPVAKNTVSSIPDLITA